MADILEDLQRDHATMSKLLGLLEREVAAFAEGGTPDYEMMQTIAAYFTDYPDSFHHPLEDVLAQRLAERDPAAAAVAETLIDQHAGLSEQARQFAAVVDNVLKETELQRQHLVDAATAFIAAQRRHIASEEQHFFPLARRILAAENLETADLAAQTAAEPLFGRERSARFAALRDSVLAYAGPDGAE
jgi:hemerythrin-like domain-containing protein